VNKSLKKKFYSLSSSYSTPSSVPFMLFGTQHFLIPLVMDSGEMSFKEVIIHCPISASDGLRMFPAGVGG
jgi:hypothetical protein